jgi:hypothetical protein
MKTTRASCVALTLLLLAPACAAISRHRHDPIGREVSEVEKTRVRSLLGGDLAQLEGLIPWEGVPRAGRPVWNFPCRAGSHVRV